MQRVTYEDDLLLHFKKYLQRLEKLTSSISKGQRRVTIEHGKLAEIAASCLCDLVLAHPYFNFGQNIAQLLVYLLNCGKLSIRTQVMNCLKQLFQEDSRYDLSLFVSCLLMFTARIFFCFLERTHTVSICYSQFPDHSSYKSFDQIQIESSPCRGVEMFANTSHQRHQFE